MRRSSLFPIAFLPVLLAGVCDPGDIELIPQLEDRFSFEAGLEGWAVVAADLGQPPGAWSVGTSTEYAATGASSLSLTLDNTSGQGKLFVKRAFDLEPGTDYQIELAFGLASGDAEDSSLWNVVVGAGLVEPFDGTSLTIVGNTGNGQSTDPGVLWTPKSGTLSVRTGPNSGRIWISIGVGATSQFARTYWVDDLSVVVRLTSF